MRSQAEGNGPEVSASGLDGVIQDTLRLARIPAPTFQEQARASALAAGLRQAGWAVTIDDAGNVVGRADAAARDKRAIAVLAHLDTVFPGDTPLDAELRGERIVGPGVGDNTLALAALLWLARTMPGRRPDVNLLLVGTVGEEGLGDLRGARAFASTHPDLWAAIVLEGHFLGRVIHAGPGSRRIRATFRGPGGHSWHDFGVPSAVHELLRAGARLIELPLPRGPKTTLNVGVVAGGSSVNSIAADASMLIDMRSDSQDALTSLYEGARAELSRLANTSPLEVQIEEVGDRPAACIPPDHWLVVQAVAALSDVGIEATLDSASTDANALLAAGIPTVTTGISQGGNMHRPDEWVAVPPIPAGLAQLSRLIQRVADSL